ncbi:threonine synthase [Candidatus Daviesbacteria bacterium RIFCSPLOWO2_02_FULL_41_8]|uniref:Threonine synthase n=3 Tax=Candidatus Daviesiibacteriota TaxID=1752718 RepID=A0A1F5NJG3_9BACT|nr:MAG: threonine synthase [Candidatus Daviesbacteria bacterium RIFCSPHIGHO2_01_FULL_41_23]OGE33292.1 MAG: threonine synthase [Candidatus Daviesbacteria bacterium RIFCSPHIGHO2_02_FULL_41_10]OGE77674.1 MAG: threonine synthase [Candidatus Daviesbacteria bacterium RIFCSPLOWO2_02_FULL_41_8]
MSGKITYYSTNDKTERVSFETALLKGMGSNYGLYMIPRQEIPKLSRKEIVGMKGASYAEIAFKVLNPFLKAEIPADQLTVLLNEAYDEKVIPTGIQRVAGAVYIMWLSGGPTYSFKDYAARFFGRTLDYFLKKRNLKKTVVVATSGDTGGAVADALHGLGNVENVVFFPRGAVSSGQRRQMTTLGGNVYAFEVNGDFDLCQALAKNLLGDKEFAKELFGDPDRLTSANSISLGRLLPQAVYPFYTYSRVGEEGEPMIVSIPSGNFGDMMGTVIAKEMGLPVSKIICGVNENTEFPEFLKTGRYSVKPTKSSPSSAMMVSHPSNLARLIDFYGGHMFDKRDKTGRVTREGVIDRMPNFESMRMDIASFAVNNKEHEDTIKQVYEKYGVLLDPHGAVGWKALERYLGGRDDQLAVVYETADPGKFPQFVKKATGIEPAIPAGIQKQAKLKERIFSIESKPCQTKSGIRLSSQQIEEAKAKIKQLLSP